MTTEDIKTATEKLVASGQPYVVATVVRCEAPTSAKAGDRAILDETGILAGWVGGGCAKPAVTRNAAEALKDGKTRLIRISRDLEGLDSGIMGYPMTCHSGGTLDIFIEPVMPKPLLVIIGQTAIAEALCALASPSGFDVTVAARRRATGSRTSTRLRRSGAGRRPSSSPRRAPAMRGGSSRRWRRMPLTSGSSRAPGRARG